MAVTIASYDQVVFRFGDGHMDLDTDSFRLELYTAAFVFNAANTQRSDISASALATGSGYTNPGQLMTAVTWGFVGAVTTWDASNVTWGASGGPISADDAVIYDDTPTAVPVDPLMFAIDFGGTQTAGDGTDFRVAFNSNGIFRVNA